MYPDVPPTDLEWQGPYVLPQFISDPAMKEAFQKPGVYLWMDHSTQPETLYYVGRATGAPDLWTRQWQHYTALIAGHYEVPGRARQCNQDWGMRYDEEVAKRLLDVERYIELVRECHAWAAHLRVYLCPLDESLVRDVERQLIYELQSGTRARGASSPPKTWRNLLHRKATWRTPSMNLRDTVRFG